MGSQGVVYILTHFCDGLPMADNIRDSYSSNEIALTNSKIVYVSTLATFATGCRVEGSDDLSSSDL
jgi:hypothetical protein